MKSLIVKLILNKKNGQMNISLPKKKIPLSLKNKLLNMKKPMLKIKIEELLKDGLYK